ncbi:MAG: IS66 family transposase [Terriglobia bacterium]
MPASETTHLPEDPAALKALLRAAQAERDRAEQRAAEHAQRAEAQAAMAQEKAALAAQQTQRADELYLQNLRLQLQLERYQKWYYGPRADRLKTRPELGQALLAFGEELAQKPLPANEVAASEPVYELRRVKRRWGRRALANFANLPVTTHVYELSPEERACPSCGAERKEIGAEESWQIEYLPGHFVRLQHIRKKYACAPCEAAGETPQIRVAARPDAPIERGLAGPGLLAYSVASKFADYLPLYRLEDIFARQGFEISRATQSVWCGDVADLVEPLYRRMAERLRASHVVATDDTVLPMLSAGKTQPARMWVYVGDAAHPYNVFDFTLRRSRDGPQEFLKNFTGVLLADAYGGYNGVVAGNALTRAGCWSHARRRFIEAESTAPEIARAVVALLRRLFAVEQQAKELSVPERLSLRQAQSAPLLAELRDKLLRWKEQLLPKHPMAEAVNYTLGQWTELKVFCSDGAVPIDNNVSEREMKRVVLNRKNSLFVGNPRGGRTAAILASLTSTCRRHEVDPQIYLTQLLLNLPTWPARELDAWLPDHWKLRQAALGQAPSQTQG